jgi:CheY-like chemotaxis protein
MELLCEDCRAVIQIADERIPYNSTFRLTCPRCKSKIVVNPNSSDVLITNTATKNAVAMSDEVLAHASNTLWEKLDESSHFLHQSPRASLLYSDPEGNPGQVKAVLQRMGYTVDVQTSVDQAVDQLRMNQYQIVVLSFLAKQQPSNSIMSYLAGLNMNIRREIFMVLIGDGFKTADHLQAFMNSANLVLHPADLAHMESLLTQGLQDHTRFYKVFLECLVESGKRL